jgi:hypothetical protein
MVKTVRVIIGLILLVVGCCQVYNAVMKPTIDDKKVLERSDLITIGVDAADKNGVVYCVTNADNTNSLGSGYTKTQTDNNFVVVTIKITNNSNEPYDVNPLNFTLLDGDKEYEHFNDALFALDNVMFLDTINPSLSNEYIIVYETPTTTEQSEYKLKIKRNVFRKTDNTYIKLKEVS